jgi:hypothetical protein
MICGIFARRIWMPMRPIALIEMFIVAIGDVASECPDYHTLNHEEPLDSHHPCHYLMIRSRPRRCCSTNADGSLWDVQCPSSRELLGDTAHDDRENTSYGLRAFPPTETKFCASSGGQSLASCHLCLGRSNRPSKPRPFSSLSFWPSPGCSFPSILPRTM